MRLITLATCLLLLVTVLGVYLVWTDGRLDRLAARVHGAWAALDAQLVRRSAAAVELAAHCRRHSIGDDRVAKAMEDAAVDAQSAGQPERESAENALSRAIRVALPAVRGADHDTKITRLTAELTTAASRVGLARQIFNDAVRDLQGLRRRRVAGAIARRRNDVVPGDFFEVDDTTIAPG